MSRRTPFPVRRRSVAGPAVRISPPARAPDSRRRGHRRPGHRHRHQHRHSRAGRRPAPPSASRRRVESSGPGVHERLLERAAGRQFLSGLPRHSRLHQRHLRAHLCRVSQSPGRTHRRRDPGHVRGDCRARPLRHDGIEARPWAWVRSGRDKRGRRSQQRSMAFRVRWRSVGAGPRNHRQRVAIHRRGRGAARAGQRPTHLPR